MEYVQSPHATSMVRFGKLHPETVVLSGDLTASTEIAAFKEELPDQFVSMGMAEQNMLSWAGGMAREGYVPFLHTFAVFLYRRPYDQLSMSVAYPNLKVRLIGFLPGIMTPGGVTHQAIEDLGVLRCVPNMTVLETGDATDVETVLEAIKDIQGPVYIRMLRGKLPRLFSADEPFVVNKARVLQTGGDVTLLSSGICTEEAMRAAASLKVHGIQVNHLHISTLKPFSDPIVSEVLSRSRLCITVENHVVQGGLGSAVADMIAEHGYATRLVKLGIPDTYAQGASKEYLMRLFGIDAQGIVYRVQEELGQHWPIDEQELCAIPIGVVGSEYAVTDDSSLSVRLEAL